ALRDFPHKWGKNFFITPLYNSSPSPPILPPLVGEGARRAEGGKMLTFYDIKIKADSLQAFFTYLVI
ncbi:hypothetical protein P9J70_08845, partial [Glaesserella parasuis]|uniref:hypothetical protein n=1 Tax=Glaesserella parasuis TaxID=738 RepID=UPI0024366950